MYDDVDLSGEMFDFEGGGPFVSQQESMYIEDDEFYPEDYYYTNDRLHMANGLSEVGSNSVADDEAAYYERISVSELFDQCIGPTLSQAASTVYPLLGLCIVCRLTCLFCSRG
jgi:hypothetical protein